jgi:hypothetical protein
VNALFRVLVPEPEQPVPLQQVQGRQERGQEEAMEAALPGLVQQEAPQGQHSNSPALE